MRETAGAVGLGQVDRDLRSRSTPMTPAGKRTETVIEDGGPQCSTSSSWAFYDKSSPLSCGDVGGDIGITTRINQLRSPLTNELASQT
jgi:hypothetical protein